MAVLHWEGLTKMMVPLQMRYLPIHVIDQVGIFGSVFLELKQVTTSRIHMAQGRYVFHPASR
jgi:hypothetical protein